MSGGDGERCLKGAGARSVWLRTDGSGHRLVVKRWPLTPLAILKLAIGIAQPQRQRRGARRTAAAGIRTPTIRSGPRIVRASGALTVELAHAYVPGFDALELLRDDPPPNETQRRLGASCGKLVADYARVGLLHRDLKLSNLVVSDDNVWVIDTDGVRRVRDRAAATARMLDRLDVQLRDLGVAVTRAARLATLRTALRPLTPSRRRAAARRLRARRRR